MLVNRFSIVYLTWACVCDVFFCVFFCCFVFFQAEDGIRDLVRSRGLGDVYKRQVKVHSEIHLLKSEIISNPPLLFHESFALLFYQ